MRPEYMDLCTCGRGGHSMPPVNWVLAGSILGCVIFWVFIGSLIWWVT